MKILQIAPYFSPYVGGQESYIYNLSKNLVKNGHNVHIITSNYPKSKYYEEIEGITIERNDLLMRPLRNPISPGYLKINKLSKMYDITQIHNLYAFPSMLAAFYKHKHDDIPLICTDHGKLVFGDRYKDFFVKMYSKYIAKLILKESDLITVLSKSQREYLSTIDPDSKDKIRIIPNAIDLELFNKLDSDTEKTNNDNFTFLYVGQMIKRKGITWLLKALQIVIKNNKNVKLILIGDGEHLGYYKKLVDDLKIRQYVEFKGRISDKALLASVYKNSDAFVLPSLSEGLPTVLLEALYFGLPVISTDINGIREHFENTVFFVPPKDSVMLAELMVYISKEDNIKNAKKLSLNFKKLIESKYNWKSVAIEYERTFEKLL